MKNSRRKLLFTSIMLAALLIFSAYATFTPDVHAAEPNIQEKGTSILNDVAGLDLAKYNVTLKDHSQDAYFDVIPEDNVGYTLESDNSKIDIYCTFANDKLHILHVLENEGAPSMTKTCNSVSEMAKDFLSDYATYSGNSLYGELSLMLDEIDAGKNLTVTLGDVELRVNASAEYTRFSWRYTFNGVVAGDKCVALGFKNGFLKYFVDTWDLYRVGSTTINLSEEEAVAIAIETAKAFSYHVGSGNDAFEVKNFNVTTAKVTQLVFCSSIGADKARGDDPLTLFPMWRIGVGLDKFYPGNVYGIYVDIWADTLEVRHVQEAFTTLDPELVSPGLFDDALGTLGSQVSSENSQSNLASLLRIAFTAAVAIMFGAPIWLRVKKRSLRFHDFPRIHLSKFIVGVLCFLLFSVILVTPVSLVKADTRRATIWGSEVWKTTTEIEQQQETAADVAWYFNSHSYVTDNYQGEGTMRSNILAQIGDSEQNYDKAAIVYFDHGIGDNKSYPPYYEPEWHYSVYDNIGTPAFDDEIYLNTTGKTFFAFISTCMSARITQGQVNISGVLHAIGYPTAQGKSPTDHAVGMAYAFTHQIVGSTMSDNGYDYPDSESFCYIGFPWGSPSLSQLVDPENHPSSYYCQWVERFFYYALANDWSVNYALDQASLYCFSDDFGGTALHNGFCPVWAEPWDDDDSTMVVYGNGNIHLYQPPTSIKVVAYGWNGQFYTNTDTDVWIDGQYAGSTNYMYITKNVATGNHTVQVGSSAPGGPFRFFAGYPWYENPITVYVGSETQTQVECGYFPMLTLDISAGTGGTTNPSGTQYHQPLNTTYVTATADEDHIFDHWLLDGANEGSNPTIEVYMDDDRTLQAVFRDKEHSLTVLAYNQYQQGAVPYWVDDEYIGLTDGSSITVLDGNHKIEVDTPLYQYPYVHVFCYYEVFYGPTYYDNPVTLSITDDETIIAWYYTDYY